MPLRFSRDTAPGPLEEQVRAALGTVTEPDVGLPITDLDMVRGVVIHRNRVQVAIALIVPLSDRRAQLHDDIAQALQSIGVRDLYVDFVHFSDEERRALRMKLQPSRSSNPADALSSTRVIAISSGKGGVGKSSISTNLAVALARRGKRTALIDADVYGFSIPRMIGIDRKPAIVDSLLIPPKAHGVAVISVAFFATDEQTPIIWRGPMLHKALQQFIADVYWNRPQYLLIDMPPGTGDVALTMSQFLPASEVVVVTTPQPAAQKVAQRAAYMARQVDLAVAGVIENMSWFTGDDGKRYELFGSGGGELLAQQLDVPLLGQIPLSPPLREGSDTGAPIVVADPDSEAARAIEAVADRLLASHRRRLDLPLINAH